MKIKYKILNEKILKIARSLGYIVQMYDEKSNGPILDSEKARYFYLQPDGILIKMPIDEGDEHNEILIKCGQKKDLHTFLQLIKLMKVVANFNGMLGLTIRNYETGNISTNDLVDELKSNKEKNKEL